MLSKMGAKIEGAGTPPFDSIEAWSELSGRRTHHHPDRIEAARLWWPAPSPGDVTVTQCIRSRGALVANLNSRAE